MATRQGLFQDFAQGGANAKYHKIKGGSCLSTNYVIRCTKNPKGGKLNPRGGGQKHPLAPPEINPARGINGLQRRVTPS